MKKWSIMLLSLLLFLGCSERKKTVKVEQSKDEETVVDSTVYGVCGESTGMHTLELISDEGDTLQYMLNDDGDYKSDVLGGKMVGDHMAVIGTKYQDELVARKVINLTSLLGKWMSIDKNFEIQEGGIVKSFVRSEKSPWTTWKILNGQLVLNKDTFSIYSLGADSLYLENKVGIFAYQRQK